LIRIVRGFCLAALLAALLPLASLTATAHDGPHDATPVAPTPQLPVTLTDATGTEVTVTDVSRIITLTGDSAEIVWELGLGANVVATDVTATYPEAYANLPKIGFGRQLSAEGVIAMNPTVVIGDTTSGPPEVIAQIREAGVPVVIIEEFTSLEAPYDKIDAIATALGVTNTGEALKARVRAEVDAALALAETATSEPRVLFIYIRGTATQLIGGAGSGADTLIEAAGGIDAGTEAGIQGFVPVTAEALVTAAPDVILVMEAGLQSVGGIDGLLQIPGMAETPAGQNRAILSFEDQYLLGLGPRLGDVLTDLVYGIHPELERRATPGAATPEAA
jgi:iron complex transport system substrate-binding protein